MGSVSGSDRTCRATASSTSDTVSMYQSMTVNATGSPREPAQAGPPCNLEPSTMQIHGSRDADELLRGIIRPMVKSSSPAGSQDTLRKRARSDDGDEGEEISPPGSDGLEEELAELHKEGEPARRLRDAKKRKRMVSLPAASPSPAPEATKAHASPPKTNSSSASTAVAKSPRDSHHHDKPSEEENPEEKPSKEPTPSPSSDKNEETPIPPASPRKT